MQHASRFALAPRVAFGALTLVALCGCRRDDAPPAGASTSPPSAPRPPSVASAAAAAPASGAAAMASPRTFGEPGELVISPAVPAREKGSMDHVDVAGWSADDLYFGHCRHSGGLGGATCVVFPRVGPSEAFGDFDEKKGAIDGAAHAKLEARKKALALASAPRKWAFARDLEITWDSPAGDTLRVGARVRGEAPSYAIVLRDPSPGAAEGSTHAELVALSADGTHLGAISHSFHAEYSDHFEAKVLPVVRLAAQAYNDAGFAHHKQKDFARSAELFATSADADPTFALAAYNLACAWARLGDARAERALSDAISRAGVDASMVKKRARDDADFASVKDAAWFAAMTKG